MIRRVLFLHFGHPFDQRDFKRFGIRLLMDNGFDVEVWNLNDVILNGSDRRTAVTPDPITWDGYKIFSDKRRLLRELMRLKTDTFVIPLFHYSRTMYFIYKAISRSNAPYASWMANVHPLLLCPKSRSNHVLRFLTRIYNVTPKKIANYIFSILPSSCIGIKPARLVIAGGKKTGSSRDPVGRLTEILWTHARDYDAYLGEREKICDEKKTAVFLDEYTPFHRDPIYYKDVPAPVSAERYYPLLHKFFTKVENELGVEVLIAAHPRSRYEGHPDYFKGRRCIKGDTMNLVRESKLVLAHCSTSLNFANLFSKPVTFITTTDIDKTAVYGFAIRVIARSFGKGPVFIDRDDKIDWESELKIDRSLYDIYRQDYIKVDGSEDAPHWQIVANRLKSGF